MHPKLIAHLTLQHCCPLIQQNLSTVMYATFLEHYNFLSKHEQRGDSEMGIVSLTHLR